MTPLSGRGAPEGVLPSQDLAALVASGAISADAPIDESLIQPASLDLRLGAFAWRVRTSFLPGAEATVREKARAAEMHRVDLAGGAVLEKGCVYVAPLLERLALPDDVSGLANPKSSTGRLDIFTRVISDRGARFDLVRRGYAGPLYAEISPKTFSVAVREGSRLAQLRLRRGAAALSADDILGLHGETPLVDRLVDAAEVAEHGSLSLRVDLSGDGRGRPVGWRARRHAGIVDVDRRGFHDPADFWEPVAPRRGGVILDPDDFYILATREAVAVPPDCAAEMVAYDALVGEFRVHYAGFFDPGFGWGGSGSRGVLEVRSRDVPFLLEHEQVIGRLRYERMAARPEKVYGAGIGSHYQGQGLRLAKQFTPPR